ncbi:MAG: hypothetical protein GF307_11970 [candidate division Zixibacteria bacterium]|nr:hypothetical protein [candidate division Zixibacteria bacterium]
MLGLVNNKFIIGKEEFYCLAAEMHYYRVHKRYWAICFERIKKAGYTMLSTSVPWNLHEEIIGQFDFNGLSEPRKDLIVFLELAREFGFKVILRCGPYIGAEWENGGIPDFIFSDTELIARDSVGEPLRAKSQIGVNGGFIPCYLHPKYLNHIKRFFTGLVESIQNYIYPKGPVFLMHIDENVSYRGNDQPFDGDYSDYSLKTLYLDFLTKKYGNIENLNIAYSRKHKKFSEVEAPTELEVKKQEELTRYFDWIEFREHTLSQYVDVVRERLESLGVGALFSTSVSLIPYLGMPVDWRNIANHKVSVGLNIEEYENYPLLARSQRYLGSSSSFNWTSRLLTGNPARDPVTAGKYDTIDLRSLRFLITSSLASGCRGFVSYMFVERDHWYNSPLGEDGTVRDNYEILSRLNYAIPKMRLESLKGFAQVGIVYDRTLLRYKALNIEEPFPYINYLVDFCLPGICKSFGWLNYDYTVTDTSGLDEIEDQKLLFVPSCEFMSEETQERIVETIKAGQNMVLIGLVPKYSDIFRPSQVLSKSLGISTRADWNFGKVQVGSSSYDTQFFGTINKRNSAWRIFAKSGSKIVGATRKMGKGTCYFLTFDPGITYDTEKKEIMEKLFSTHKITTPVTSSDPNVDVIAQSDGAKSSVLYLINHAHRYDCDCPDNIRRVVLKVDASLVGSSGSAKLKLTDLLSDEEIPCTAKNLVEGMNIEIGNMDSRIYLIEKR